jgi:hypothetical protein
MNVAQATIKVLYILIHHDRNSYQQKKMVNIGLIQTSQLMIIISIKTLLILSIKFPPYMTMF